jgi:hypothetical protein
MRRSSIVEFCKKFVGAPHVRYHDTSTHYKRYIERLLLLIASRPQTVGLNDVVLDAIVTTESCGHHEPHEFLEFGRNGALQIGVVIDVVETLYEEVVGLLDGSVEPRSGLEKSACNLAFVRYLLIRVQIGRFFTFDGHKAHRVAEDGMHRLLPPTANRTLKRVGAHYGGHEAVTVP